MSTINYMKKKTVNLIFLFGVPIFVPKNAESTIKKSGRNKNAYVSFANGRALIGEAEWGGCECPENDSGERSSCRNKSYCQRKLRKKNEKKLRNGI